MEVILDLSNGDYVVPLTIEEISTLKRDCKLHGTLLFYNGGEKEELLIFVYIFSKKRIESLKKNLRNKKVPFSYGSHSLKFVTQKRAHVLILEKEYCMEGLEEELIKEAKTSEIRYDSNLLRKILVYCKNPP